MFYRSASLYHPQRRAVLHLKSQKRKIKEKNKSQADQPPFLDISSLKSVTIRILALSVAVTSCGIYTPLIYMVSYQPNNNLSKISKYCPGHPSQTRRPDCGRYSVLARLPWSRYDCRDCDIWLSVSTEVRRVSSRETVPVSGPPPYLWDINTSPHYCTGISWILYICHGLWCLPGRIHLLSQDVHIPEGQGKELLQSLEFDPVLSIITSPTGGISDRVY